MAKTVEQQRAELHELATNIVYKQTNRYIKELLREHDITIGSTKADFDRNITAAIDDGRLTREHLEAWLLETEGWGDQHAYLYRLTNAERSRFSTEAKAHDAVRQARLSTYWAKATAVVDRLRFPDEDVLQLASITYDDGLRLHWHNGMTYWVRTADEEKYDKDREQIEGFWYEFRAHRGRVTREVMRFDIRPDDGLAALFIPRPIRSSSHQIAFETAKATIDKLVSFDNLERRAVNTKRVIRNLDQALDKDSSALPEIESQSTRLQDGQAYIEFASRTTDGNYRDSAPVKAVRESITTPEQVEKFEGASATFRFVRPEDLGRVQVFGDGRIRLWKTLQREQVWKILLALAHKE